MNIFVIILICSSIELSFETIFKETFTASANKYERFYLVNYKAVLIPSNLYDLTITVKFVKWIGFQTLCPKSINLTAVLQKGTFPLFKYDSLFQSDIDNSDKLDIFMFDPKLGNSTKTYSLKSPKPGHWFFGSIYDSNDDFNHYVICSADVIVEMIGLLTPPSMTVLLPRSGSPLIIPFSINNTESVLFEIKSNEVLSGVIVQLQNAANDMIISVAVDSVPEIRTIDDAIRHGVIFKSGDVVTSITRPQINLRLLLQVRGAYGPMGDVQLSVHFTKMLDEVGEVEMLPLAASVKEGMVFTYRFTSVDNESNTLSRVLPSGKIITQPIYVEPIRGQGGVLTIDLSIGKLTNNGSSNTSIYLCIGDTGYSTVLDVKASKKCESTPSESSVARMVINKSFYYPRWGLWYITMLVDDSDGSSDWKVDLAISSRRCKSSPKLCSGHGHCLLSAFDSGLISSCHCVTTYYGLDCRYEYEFDQVAVRHSIYKRKWLVLSNLVFVPAIIISIVQRLYLLSVVYAVTMTSSMAYHICSSKDLIERMCILPEEQLVYYDHIAAALSIWVSLMALTTLSTKHQSVLNMLMMCALIVMGYNIQKSIWMYSSSVIIGLIIIIISWTYRMYLLKCIFPPIDWWLFGLVPGVSLVVAGFVFFRLSTYEHYQYYFYHSIWHILVSVAICFILPNTNRWSKALKKTTSMELINQEFGHSRRHKWRQMKKNVNYYLHLDILTDYLIYHYPKCVVLKSY